VAFEKCLSVGSTKASLSLSLKNVFRDEAMMYPWL